MADRVSASIVIGGQVTPDQWRTLLDLIANEGLAADWDAPAFTPDQHIEGEPLRLYAHETPWGMFDALEQFCCGEGVAYTRWSGACPGSFGAERIVFDGRTGPLNYDVDEDDHVVLHAHTIGQLGSMRAIRRYLKAADIEVPALFLTA